MATRICETLSPLYQLSYAGFKTCDRIRTGTCGLEINVVSQAFAKKWTATRKWLNIRCSTIELRTAVSRTAGFEPATYGFKCSSTGIRRKKWVAERGIEPRSNDYRSFAHPLTLHRYREFDIGAAGLEPATLR
jgi:hypothetical protein